MGHFFQDLTRSLRGGLLAEPAHDIVPQGSHPKDLKQVPEAGRWNWRVGGPCMLEDALKLKKGQNMANGTVTSEEATTPSCKKQPGYYATESERNTIVFSVNVASEYPLDIGSCGRSPRTGDLERERPNESIPFSPIYMLCFRCRVFYSREALVSRHPCIKLPPVLLSTTDHSA